ncbi:hypothetical protein [Streptomyces sp. NPDC088816]|uniref:hypothetical protein n=1 Tax=Streptomyces sp. NPDC088816 TaxID=3365906 RepID=UPI003804ED33
MVHIHAGEPRQYAAVLFGPGAARPNASSSAAPAGPAAGRRRLGGRPGALLVVAVVHGEASGCRR